MQPPKHSKKLRAVYFYFGNSGGYVIWLMSICIPSLGMECEEVPAVNIGGKLPFIEKGLGLH